MEQRAIDHGERAAMARVANASPAGRAAIEVVSDDRMPVRREVDADLVRAAGSRRELQVGDRGEPRERPVFRDGGLAAAATFIRRPSLGSRESGSTNVPRAGRGWPQTSAR
jgi:hypothetical protein